MVLLSPSRISLTHYDYGIIGRFLTPPLFVAVVKSFPRNTYYIVQLEVSPQFVTMRLETSLLLYLLKPATVLTIEPRLQPLTGEHLSFSSSNSSQEARLDIAANGVWGSHFVRSFLTFGSLIRLLLLIVYPPSPLRTENMRKIRLGLTNNRS